MKARILQICQPTEGGVAHQVAVLAKRHAEKGHHVEVACAKEGSLVRELEEAGITVHAISLVRPPSPGADLKALLALRRIMKAGGFDLVHAHSAKAGVIGRAAAWLSGVPAVYSPHAWSFLSAGSAPMRLVYLAVERWLARWATRQIICVSTEELELGSETLGPAARGKLRLVPNGIRVPAGVSGAVEARRRSGLAHRRGQRDAATVDTAARGSGAARSRGARA